MRWLKWLGLGSIGLALAIAFAVGVWALLPASTPAIDAPDGIAAIERIPIGGAEHTVLLRGRDRAAPVLLYVHGGPGAGQLPLARGYSDRLEEHFVVAHWDQRGAGASCEGTDWDALSLERSVADAIALSAHLAGRFGGGGKIVLLGHSWGSVVGALAVQQRPDLFHAYVGLGQLVHGERNEILSYDWVLGEARRRGDDAALAELATVTPPYRDNDALGLQRKWLNAYGGSIHALDRALPALWRVAFGREYTLGTRLSYFDCMGRSLAALWPAVARTDFLAEIPRLEVPVLLFTGRHDWNTPFPLVEEWAARLEAPHVEIVWFDDAGHMINLEAPEAFQRALIEKALPFTR